METMKIAGISGICKAIYHNDTVNYCYLERNIDKVLNFHLIILLSLK